MLGGIHGKGKRYTFCCNTCSTKWSQLKPDLVGPNGDRQLSASSKAIHLTDKRRSNGYRCNIRNVGCGRMLNKKLASLHDEEPCICIRRKKQTQVREEYTHKPVGADQVDVQPQISNIRVVDSIFATSVTTSLEDIMAKATSLASNNKKFMLRNMLHSGHQTTTKATHPQYNVIADTIGLLKTGNAVTKLFPTSAHD